MRVRQVLGVWATVSPKATSYFDFELFFLNVYRYETVVTNLEQLCSGDGYFRKNNLHLKLSA